MHEDTGRPRGLFGVLAHDPATERVLCHVCGNWFGRLTSHHLKSHGLTAASYKRYYGLPQTTALEAPGVGARRRLQRQRTKPNTLLPIDDDTLFGERGVLAYDEALDRIQCHACGRWFQKITAHHLKLHGLTIAGYKERYGLNIGTALETPRITDLRRRQAEQRMAKGLFVPSSKGLPRAGSTRGYRRRAQYIKTYHTPEALKEMGRLRRRWTDKKMLEALRAAQAEAGGVLTRRYLDTHRTSERGALPSASAVVKRFGSWQRVCEVLGQPYRTTPLPRPPGALRRWSDNEILARLRELQAECGGMVYPIDLQRGSAGPGKKGAYPSHTLVVRRFGSWRKVCELLGQPYFRRRAPQGKRRRPRSGLRRAPWGTEEMLEALRAAQAEAGGVLTRHYLDRRSAERPGKHYPWSQAVIRRFGSWQRVCELLGQPYRKTRVPPAPGTARQWSDEAILEALRRLQDELGRPLSARYLYRLRSGRKGAAGAFPSYKTVLDRFGSWRRVSELLGPPRIPAGAGAGSHANQQAQGCTT